jgi:hypothetical protein
MAHTPSYDAGSPAATGLVSALAGSIEQARSLANVSLRRFERGTSTNFGSPTYLPRSANASALASR